MTYTRPVAPWQNLPSTATPVPATWFTGVDDALTDLDNTRVPALEAAAAIAATSPVGYVVIDSSLSSPSGSIDATQAFVNAFATGKPVFVPPGTYTVTSWAPPTKSQVIGCGQDSTTIRYAGTGTMCTLTNLQRNKFVDLKFLLIDPAGILFSVSNTFRASWTRCVFQGQHTAIADSYASTSGHIGVVLTSNSGDNLFIDCDFLNLGVGIKTDSIQNGVIGGKFGSNYVGIYGSGGGGMALSGYVDFVAAATSSPTLTHIQIDGATGQWWLENVWIEGCATGIQVGNGSAGPAQFSMTACKVAATTTCIDVQNARNPTLWNVYLAGDNANAATPTPISVNSTNAPEGVAFLDSIITGGAIATSSFPAAWTVQTRSGSTSTLQAPSSLEFQFGSKLRMRRSDASLVDVLTQTGGPRIYFGLPSANATEAAQFRDTSGATALGIDAVTSTVNYLAAKPAAANGAPQLAARGSDTNVNLSLLAKGTGQVQIAGNALFIANDGSTPGTPTGGGVLYVEAGALKYKGSSGTVTTLGVA